MMRKRFVQAERFAERSPLALMRVVAHLKVVFPAHASTNRRYDVLRATLNLTYQPITHSFIHSHLQREDEAGDVGTDLNGASFIN